MDTHLIRTVVSYPGAFGDHWIYLVPYNARREQLNFSSETGAVISRLDTQGPVGDITLHGLAFAFGIANTSLNLVEHGALVWGPIFVMVSGAAGRVCVFESIRYDVGNVLLPGQVQADVLRSDLLDFARRCQDARTQTNFDIDPGRNGRRGVRAISRLEPPPQGALDRPAYDEPYYSFLGRDSGGHDRI